MAEAWAQVAADDVVSLVDTAQDIFESLQEACIVRDEAAGTESLTNLIHVLSASFEAKMTATSAAAAAFDEQKRDPMGRPEEPPTVDMSALQHERDELRTVCGDQSNNSAIPVAQLTP